MQKSTLIAVALFAASSSAFAQNSADDCDIAQHVSDGSHTFDTTAATPSGIEAGVGICDDFGQGNPNGLNIDVWFLFTPGFSGTYEISSCGTVSYDSKLAIYSGGCVSPVVLDCNDDGPGCPGFSSLMSISGMTAGTEYLVQVGAFAAGAVGTGSLSFVQTGGPAPVGSNFCISDANSSGAAAVMGAEGSASVSTGDLTLTAGPGPVGEPGIFYYGPNQIQASFGNGTRCVGGPSGSLHLIYPRNPFGRDGVLRRAVVFSSPAHAAQLTPGSSWFFQAWFRDPAAGGFGFDLSDGYQISLLP